MITHRIAHFSTLFYTDVWTEDFIENAEGLSCKNKNNFPLKIFPVPKDSMPNTTIVKEQCKEFCRTKKECLGCFFQCNKTCEWSAVTSCQNNQNLEQSVRKTFSQKPSKHNFILIIHFSADQKYIFYE